MAEDFDDYMDEEYDDEDFDFELTEEEIAEIRRAEQDANMGFVYEMVDTDEGRGLKCGKCGRIANFRERPFPHRFDCPMKR